MPTTHAVTDLHDAVRRTLHLARDAVRSELVAAQDGARTDGPERAANRGERGAVTAQGFLTAALGARLRELDVALAALDALVPGPRIEAAPGSLVSLEDEAAEALHVLVVPGAPGAHLAEAPDVLAVTPASPLGAALLGAQVGDEVTHRRGGRDVTLYVTSIR